LKNLIFYANDFRQKLAKFEHSSLSCKKSIMAGASHNQGVGMEGDAYAYAYAYAAVIEKKIKQFNRASACFDVSSLVNYSGSTFFCARRFKLGLDENSIYFININKIQEYILLFASLAPFISSSSVMLLPLQPGGGG